ncbi:DEAD/DEAH box helicase [Paraburkholderia sp. RL18-103-BIB-C]|uniref:DEAD/DEAH box helicase n=1 Tax=Paraburkholderia sp. RL18-103-BIB-C TaxID=3031637 RepID=UPI0038B9E452
MKLEPFQRAGGDWLADRARGYLGDAPGLGKTPQAIHAADRVGARRVLVVCPALGRQMWKRQFERWSVWAPEVFVESYDKVARDKPLRKRIRAWAPDVAILDEAHYLINPEAKRTRAVYGAYCKGAGLASIARHVWPMSGTPIPTHAGNAFPVLRAVFPETLTDRTSTYAGFLDRYCEQEHTDYGMRITGNRNAAELRAILESVMLRRTSEVWTGPPIFWQDPYVIEPAAVAHELEALETSPEFEPLRRVIEAAALDSTKTLWADETDSLVWAAVRRLTAMAKAGTVADILADELEAGAYEKVLIFGQHRAALAVVAEKLAPFGVVQIHGGQSDTFRADAQARFQTDPRTRVAVLQIDAGHHTITLTAANHVVFIEQSLTPDINVQAAKRAHRYGQTRPVFVRPFALAGSVDEAVSQIVTRKARDILQLIGD